MPSSRRKAWELEVVMPGRTYLFRANNDREFRGWLHMLNAARSGGMLAPRAAVPMAGPSAPAAVPMAGPSAPPAPMAGGVAPAGRVMSDEGRGMFLAAVDADEKRAAGSGNLV